MRIPDRSDRPKERCSRVDRHAVLAFWMESYDPELPAPSAARFLDRPEVAELEQLDDDCVTRAVRETKRLPDILALAKHFAALDLLPTPADGDAGGSGRPSPTRAERRAQRRWWRRTRDPG